VLVVLRGESRCCTRIPLDYVARAELYLFISNLHWLGSALDSVHSLFERSVIDVGG
jgi:hypothetical protein